MLVQNLSVTYKCYSSIGNSLDLEKMMYEVLRTFVSETYACYALFTLNEENEEKTITSFGKKEDIDLKSLESYQESINRKEFEDKVIVILRLKHGSIYTVTKTLGVDCSFFLSMFESFIHKLNISVESCLNVKKMHEANLLLEEQKKELKLANKAKDDFLANMSHELKTPLNSINVISSVMKKNTQKNLTHKQIRNLEIINNSGKELLFLVNDVLDLAKLEAGMITLDCIDIDFKSFMQNIYDSIKPQTKAKNIEFNLQVDDTIETIFSDENRINQIIKNLLSNSIKFTQNGKIDLIVKDKKENISISVKDNGIGIEKNKLDNIFDRFKQVDESTTRKYGGTGLGLAICKELSVLLKGDIQVQSTPKIGSEFTLIIPKHIEASNIQSNTNKPKNSSSNKIKMAKNESVLVYNNNPVYFFNIIVELYKKYNVVQENDFNSFLYSCFYNNVSKIIIDITSLNDNELDMIEKVATDKFIFISDENTNSKLLNNNILSIEKTEIQDFIKTI